MEGYSSSAWESSVRELLPGGVDNTAADIDVVELGPGFAHPNESVAEHESSELQLDAGKCVLDLSGQSSRRRGAGRPRKRVAEKEGRASQGTTSQASVPAGHILSGIAGQPVAQTRPNDYNPDPELTLCCNETGFPYWGIGAEGHGLAMKFALLDVLQACLKYATIDGACLDDKVLAIAARYLDPSYHITSDVVQESDTNVNRKSASTMLKKLACCMFHMSRAHKFTFEKHLLADMTADRLLLYSEFCSYDETPMLTRIQGSKVPVAEAMQFIPAHLYYLSAAQAGQILPDVTTTAKLLQVRSSGGNVVYANGKYYFFVLELLSQQYAHHGEKHCTGDETSPATSLWCIQEFNSICFAFERSHCGFSISQLSN
eukprot:2908292-Amphidinium_carterae.2